MTTGSLPRTAAARRRPFAAAVLVGVATAVAAAAVVACLLTIPLFAMARFTEPARGTGREWFQDGLRWAALLGLGFGSLTGAVLGWWYRSGRSWPEPPVEESGPA